MRQRPGRRVRAAATVAAGTLLLAACTSGGTAAPGETDSPEPTAPTSSAAPQAAEISLAVYGPESLVLAYRRMAERFTDLNPHITVDVTDTGTVDALVEKMLSGGTAQGEVPDVFVVDHDRLPQLLEDGAVQPVDMLLGERGVNFGDGFQRAGLEAFAEEAALQCMPHDVSPRVVYYNRDLVDPSRAGEPGTPPPNAQTGWTWEEFTTAARRASRGRSEGVYLEPSITSLAPFVWSAGGEIADDPTFPETLTLSDGDTREALEQVLALVRDPVVTPTEDEVEKMRPLTRFKRGRLGMIVGTRALTPVLRKVEGLSFDVMPLPGLGSRGSYRSIADMTGYCISAGTDEVAAAADFVAFASGRRGSAITTESGYVVPANLDVANSRSFSQPSAQPQSASVFNESVRRTLTTPFVPEWREMQQQIDPLLHRLFHAPVIDLDTLLADIEAVADQALLGEPDEPLL